jgi:hypothetical protein
MTFNFSPSSQLFTLFDNITTARQRTRHKHTSMQRHVYNQPVRTQLSCDLDITLCDPFVYALSLSLWIYLSARERIRCLMQGSAGHRFLNVWTSLHKGFEKGLKESSRGTAALTKSRRTKNHQTPKVRSTGLPV